MREYDHIEAARWFLDEASIAIKEDFSKLPPRCFQVPRPNDYYHVIILREMSDLVDYISHLGEEASQIFDEWVLSERNSAGRALDISMPVRLNQGIVQTAVLIEEAEEKLARYEDRIETAAESANFDTGGQYETGAKERLRLMDKIVNRTRLFLHAHLWLHWTSESLDQANQVRLLIEEYGRFENAGDGAYAFFAFPPLSVATLSCTAMIEEVGAMYINQFTTDSVNPDNTSCSVIIDLLERHYDDIGDFDVASIREIVVNARNKISHYLTKRKGLVGVEMFNQYALAITQSVFLVRSLVFDLIFDTINRFPGFIAGIDDIEGQR